MGDNLENLVASNSNRRFNWETSLKEVLGGLHSSGEFSDLEIIVGSGSGSEGSGGKSFRVHCAIVAQMSPLLREKIQEMYPHQIQGSLEFPEIARDSMELLLEYIYCGTCSLKPGSGMSGNEVEDEVSKILDLFETAQYFKISGLAEMCTFLLKKSLRRENANANALKLLELVEKRQAQAISTFTSHHDHEVLTELALTHICRNGQSILESKDFENLSIPSVTKIIEKDELQVDRECVVFNAICRWGLAEYSRVGLDPDPDNPNPNPTQLRRVLANLLPLVRFPLLSHVELRVHVQHKNLLTSEELWNLLTYFPTSTPTPTHAHDEGEEQLSSLNPNVNGNQMFNTKPRFPCNLRERERENPVQLQSVQIQTTLIPIHLSETKEQGLKPQTETQILIDQTSTATSASTAVRVGDQDQDRDTDTPHEEDLYILLKSKTDKSFTLCIYGLKTSSTVMDLKKRLWEGFEYPYCHRINTGVAENPETEIKDETAVGVRSARSKNLRDFGIQNGSIVQLEYSWSYGASKLDCPNCGYTRVYCKTPSLLWSLFKKSSCKDRTIIILGIAFPILLALGIFLALVYFIYNIPERRSERECILRG